MNLEIRKYLVWEKRRQPQVADLLEKKVSKYDDIKAEFLHWLETRQYDVQSPVTVEGYSAAQIYEMAPGLDGIGVYNFLVDLRDDPEMAKRAIADGFRMFD